MRRATILICGIAAAVCAGPGAARAACTGDCNGNNTVQISELVTGVNISLNLAPISQCPAFDPDQNGTVTIADLITAVNNALKGCPATPTVPAATATQTAAATSTATPIATATSTAPSSPTATGTSPSTATATITVPAATATSTATSVSTNTAGATVTATAVSTSTGAATATAESTATAASTATSTVPAPSATVSATPTASFTPTASPTMGASAECGNGFLEPGETCESCAADCIVSPCTPTASMTSFAVQFTGVTGTVPTTVTVLLGYQSDLLSIPGTGNAVSVRQRITYPAPAPFPQAPNDLDYAVRLVIGRSAGFNDGLLATVKFDQCQGAPAPMPVDFGCIVEACAGVGGAITGCTCTVTEP